MSAMLVEIVLQAWDSLRRNPTRSILTMLGIVWGIASVTLLMAYGSGFRSLMMGVFQNFSKSAIIVFPGQTSMQAGGERAGRRVRFDVADLEAVRLECTLLREICPETIRRVNLSYGDRLVSLNVRGVCAEYGEIRSEIPSEGRWITKEDQAERRRVAFLGHWAKEKLFAGRPAVGETITIQGARFTVIGVMDRKLSFANYYGPDDRSVFIPYETAGELWDARYPSNAVLQPVAPVYEVQAEQQFRAAMAKRLRFDPRDERALTAFGTSTIRPIIDGLTIGLQALLLFIGALTLAIGGIGLMNILLVSVTERTREIGLRKAIGAKRGSILAQFLLESVVMCVSGGIIGILLGYAATVFVAGLLKVPPLISPQAVGLAFGFSAMVGLFFGLYPALRASKLEPIEALRYE